MFSNRLKWCRLCLKLAEMSRFKTTDGCQEIGKWEYTVLDSFCQSWQGKCILLSIEFYRSGSASRMILVRFGKETSKGYDNGGGLYFSTLFSLCLPLKVALFFLLLHFINK